MTDMRRRRFSRTQIVTLIFAVPILLFSGVGFAAKFIEFIHTFQGDAAGAFAITPMVNYLLASAGFFCLLVWATLNGMFRDIEEPKRTMLEHDALLDRRRPYNSAMKSGKELS